jgi:hypothetical protein
MSFKQTLFPANIWWSYSFNLGWAPSDSLSCMRIVTCTQALSVDSLVAHMAKYGRVVQSARCVYRFHFTMQISPDAAPSFIDLQDAGSHLAE